MLKFEITKLAWSSLIKCRVSKCESFLDCVLQARRDLWLVFIENLWFYDLQLLVAACEQLSMLLNCCVDCFSLYLRGIWIQHRDYHFYGNEFNVVLFTSSERRERTFRSWTGEGRVHVEKDSRKSSKKVSSFLDRFSVSLTRAPLTTGRCSLKQ